MDLISNRTDRLDGRTQDRHSQDGQLLDGNARDGHPRDGRLDQHRVATLSAEDRRRLLGTLPSIEQAKGILMGFYGVTADTAFATLVRWSQTSNVKLHLISETIIRTATAVADPGREPFAALRTLLADVERLNEHGAREGRREGQDGH